MNENNEVGSHHGPPVLLTRDINLLEAYTEWVTTVRKESHRGYGEHWLPGYPDWIKSRLFWRIRSGKKPLKYAPPTCWSCPWYEVIEMPEVHTTIEPIRIIDDEGKIFACVAQCKYGVVQSGSLEGPDHAATISYGHYHFKVWNANHTYKTEQYVDGVMREGEDTRWTGHIQYLLTVGDQKSVTPR